MDEQDPQIERFSRAFCALDDEALAAMSNRGLVRRARKDLEKSLPQIKSAEGEQLQLEHEGCQVLLNCAPAKSVCTCSGGICRHILACIMHVKGLGAAAGPVALQADPTAEISQLSDNDLIKWAGRAMFRQALKLASECELRVDTSSGISLRIPQFNVACRWIAGSGLDGMLCTCHAPGPCEHRLTAILLFQASLGQRTIETAGSGSPQEATGVVRTREDVLGAVNNVLCEMLDLGLSRLSRSTEERLRTLGVSAHGVDLPRMERLLKALADEVRLGLEHNAQAATTQLLSTSASVWALSSALRNPTPMLVGQHRSTYQKLSGDLELIGMGARQWQTRSGYVGLTLYFWSPADNCWNTWSDVRPVSQQFNPAVRFTSDGPWSGCPSPRVASLGQMRMQNVWRNPAGRLSGRASTTMLRVHDADPASVPPVKLWKDLLPQVESVYARTFSIRHEGADIVWLSPAQWSDGQFDEIHQRAFRMAADAEGHALPIILPHNPFAAEGVTFLQTAQRDDLGCVLGQIRMIPEGLFIEPISIYCRDRRIDLTLEGSANQAQAQNQPAGYEEEAEPEQTVEESELPIPVSAVGQFLAGIRRELEALAEAGVCSCPDISAIRRFASECDNIGLSLCAGPLSQVAETWDAFRKSPHRNATPPAQALLRGYFIAQRAAHLEAIVWATQDLR